MKTRIFSLILTLSLVCGASLSHAQEAGEKEILTGMFIERGDGTFLHVEMVGVRMIITLLDENLQPVEEDVFTRGVMRVNVKGRDSERMVIRPTGEGKALQSVKTIRKPHILEARGRLFKGDDDTTGEAFFVRYNQHRLEEKEVIPVPEE